MPCMTIVGFIAIPMPAELWRYGSDYPSIHLLAKSCGAIIMVAFVAAVGSLI